MIERDQLDRPKLFVDGRWRDSEGEMLAVIDAASEHVLGHARMATEQDIDAAVAAARRGLNGPWAAFSRADRADLLNRFAAALWSRAEDTAALVSHENGMPIRLSTSANGHSAAAIFRYYARTLTTAPDAELRAGKAGRRTLVRHRPVGVVAAITPWNYPQGIAAMKLAPALAAGCSVVLKPAPETALDAYIFAEAALEVGLPDGVLNVVPGGRTAGMQLVVHDGVDKVAFTGSTAAGREIGAACGRLLRPVTLELGGKSAAILTDDVDVSAFTDSLLDVSLPNNGQTCHASTRILAPRSRYAEVVDAVTDVVRALVVGNPLDWSTQIGPLVSSTQQARVLSFIATGKRDGARLLTGGGVPTGLDTGWYVEPTVFADVDSASAIAREEIFGPVLCITPYDRLDDAVRLANDSEYGLAGTVWTHDEDHGISLADRVDSGTVGVNWYELDLAAPFGGVKSSGLGRELGPEGLLAYLETKSIYLAPAPQTATS